jgi:plastocyanin
MDEHGKHDGGHGESHGVHLPDPSIWPLVVGVAALIAAVALIWWSRDPDHAFSGPLVGMGITAVLLSTFGWAWEDTRMRRKAEQGHGPAPKAPRFTQVLTFAIAEGQLGTARARGGVLAAVDRTDLRDLDGFEDLRITVSPSNEGPAQVLVETTWSDREAMAGYDSTRQSLLDLVSTYEQQIVPGTVQAFDMEVVRDTKEAPFRFGWGAALTVVASLTLFGLLVGVTLSLFESDAVASEGGGGPPVPADPFTVVATDNKFASTTLVSAPNIDVTFTLVNRGRAKHNLAFYNQKGGSELAPGAVGEIIDGGGKTVDVKFKAPGPGSYYFQCDVHPDQMVGTYEVREGGPVPGTPPAAPGSATPAATPTR